jgi:zinc/manganese transport system substrate-binding protein
VPGRRVIHPPLALVALLLAAVLASCGGDGVRAGGADGEVRVVATTTQVADLVRQLGGDRVEVSALLHPGSDPHGYEPRPSDVAAIADADVVFSSGGEVDEWLGDLIDNAGGDARAIALIDSVETIEVDGETDPHWWQDPRNARLALAPIRQALAEANPDGASRYRLAASAYGRELRRLDAHLADCFDSLPPTARKLVTTHDSLAYLARRYRLEVVGAVIPSLSTQAQPSAGDVEALIDQIESEQVAAVFPESGISQKLERAISRESGAEIGGELWTDSLGPNGSGAETYVRAMRANADSLVRGMSGGTRGCSG